MKTVLALIFSACIMSAQLKTLVSTDAPSYIDLNGNFSYLNLNKVSTSDSRLTDARTPLPHVHLIADITSLQTTLDAKAPLASPTFTGTVSGVTAAMVGLGNVNNTSDLSKPISTATQAALDGKAPLNSLLSTLAVSYTSPTVLTIGTGCSAAAPCNVRFGNTVWSIQRSATATIASASGTAYVWVDKTGTLLVGHNLSVTCSSGCTSQSGVTSFPAGVIPIATWTATSGTWDSTGGSDFRSWLSTNVLSPGQGIALTDTGTSVTVSVDGSVPRAIASGSTPLGTSSIASGACATVITVAATGLLTTDVVTASFNGNPTGVIGYIPSTNGMLAIIVYPTAGAVNFEVCNNTAATIIPGAITLNWKVVR